MRVFSRLKLPVVLLSALLFVALAAPPSVGPALAAEPPSKTHGGVTLVGAPYDADQGAFFEALRKALDLKARLPADLRQDLAAVDRVSYAPPSPARTFAVPRSPLAGIFSLDPGGGPPSVMIFKDARYTSPEDLLVTLVANAYTMADYKAGAKPPQPGTPQADQRECQILSAMLRTAKAVEAPQAKVDGIERSAKRRGC